MGQSWVGIWFLRSKRRRCFVGGGYLGACDSSWGGRRGMTLMNHINRQTRDKHGYHDLLVDLERR